MKSFIKASCVFVLALSLAACSKDDDPKRGKVTPPAGDSGQDGGSNGAGKATNQLEPKATLESLAKFVGAGGEVLREESLLLKVSLPEADGKTLTEYNVSVELTSIAASEEKPLGGSDVLNMKLNDEEQELVRIQILNADASKLMVVRFGDADLVTGDAYVFVRGDNGELSLAERLVLVAGETDEQLENLLKKYTQAEASGGEDTYEVTDSQGNTHVIKRSDAQKNRGK